MGTPLTTIKGGIVSLPKEDTPLIRTLLLSLGSGTHRRDIYTGHFPCREFSELGVLLMVISSDSTVEVGIAQPLCFPLLYPSAVTTTSSKPAISSHQGDIDNRPGIDIDLLGGGNQYKRPAIPPSSGARKGNSPINIG